MAVRAALVVGFALVACAPPAEPDKPLASLAWPEPSTKFTAEYWGEQAKADSKVWRQAVDWCAEETRKLLPNCQTVGQVRFVRTLKDSAARRSEPYDGQGGVEMPPAVQGQLKGSQAADDSAPPRSAEPVP
jgi:hypothetical protein